VTLADLLASAARPDLAPPDDEFAT